MFRKLETLTVDKSDLENTKEVLEVELANAR